MVEYDGYIDRSRLPTIISAESSLYSKRFFFDFARSVIYNEEKDKSKLSIGIQFTHEYKKLEYQDLFNGNLFGNIFDEINVSDKSRYVAQKTSAYILSDLNKYGKLKFDFSNIAVENRFKDYQVNFSISELFIKKKQSNLKIEWDKEFNFFKLKLDFNKSLRDKFISDYTKFTLSSNSIKNFELKLNALSSKLSPNLNYTLFRSAYLDYNWYNPNLKDQELLSLSTELSYKEIIKILAEYNTINNYTFFRESTNSLLGETDNFRKAIPNQIDSEIKYLKIRLFSKIDFGKFSFINTGQYQEKDQEFLLDELSTLNVPEWITRNTIMYSNSIFNNSLYIQTGLTFNYFTKFYADYYNPLLSEFVTQNYKEIGDYPRFDFFFNAKIQQTRVFIKVEHLNSSFTGYDFYSDIFNPYRDLSVRFGLVWNFFQ